MIPVAANELRIYFAELERSALTTPIWLLAFHQIWSGLEPDARAILHIHGFYLGDIPNQDGPGSFRYCKMILSELRIKSG